MSLGNIVVYGIPHCDSVKKARLFLAEHDVDYQFYNYKIETLNSELLNRLIDVFGFERVFNRKSTSYRQLTESQKAQVGLHVDEIKRLNAGIKMMLSQPSLIKRPIVVGNFKGQHIALIGFNAAEYASHF